MNEQQRGAEDIYSRVPLKEIPWNSEEPPQLLVELIESGKVKLGRTLDLGCGLGNCAIWLAGCGFEVVGADASPTAIKIANRNAKKKNVKCKFVVGDVTGSWADFGTGFDFVYDWGLLHHIFPEQRGKYVENVHRVLKPAGKYLSVCFNEKDIAFEGSGKYRKTRFGGMVYLSSETELRELFGSLFEIIDFRVLEIVAKIMTHIFNYCFMKRKGN
jgi:SAM-dependent methyltransferase